MTIILFLLFLVMMCCNSILLMQVLKFRAKAEDAQDALNNAIAYAQEAKDDAERMERICSHWMDHAVELRMKLGNDWIWVEPDAPMIVPDWKEKMNADMLDSEQDFHGNN